MTLKFARSLIVAAIVLIILIAKPKLINEGAYAREMAAEKAITTIHTAEKQYYLEYGRYATTLEMLGPRGAGLIDGDLARGEKSEFTFSLRSTPAGYSVTAIPSSSGQHTFYSDQNHPVWSDPVPGR